MRRIQKKEGWEPHALTAYKGQSTEDWEPSYKDMDSKTKNKLKADLTQEQYGLCCYCEVCLSIVNSHIEHIKPQSLYPESALDYGNMVCSCQNRMTHREPRHCGTLKGGWYDEVLFVSPLSVDCGERFAFGIDGSIRAADQSDEAASKTIKMLGLGIDKLNARRAKAIEPFLDEELTKEDVDAFVAAYLAVSEDGLLNAFHSTILYLHHVGAFGFET